MAFPFKQDLRTRSAPSGSEESLAPHYLQLQPDGAPSEECEHKEVEQGEHYYGREEHEYYTYWFCLNCEEEIE